MMDIGILDDGYYTMDTLEDGRYFGVLLRL